MISGRAVDTGVRFRDQRKLIEPYSTAKRSTSSSVVQEVLFDDLCRREVARFLKTARYGACCRRTSHNFVINPFACARTVHTGCLNANLVSSYRFHESNLRTLCIPTWNSTERKNSISISDARGSRSLEFLSTIVFVVKNKIKRRRCNLHPYSGKNERVQECRPWGTWALR